MQRLQYRQTFMWKVLTRPPLSLFFSSFSPPAPLPRTRPCPPCISFSLVILFLSFFLLLCSNPFPFPIFFPLSSSLFFAIQRFLLLHSYCPPSSPCLFSPCYCSSCVSFPPLRSCSSSDPLQPVLSLLFSLLHFLLLVLVLIFLLFCFIMSLFVILVLVLSLVNSG